VRDIDLLECANAQNFNVERTVAGPLDAAEFAAFLQPVAEPVFAKNDLALILNVVRF